MLSPPSEEKNESSVLLLHAGLHVSPTLRPQTPSISVLGSKCVSAYEITPNTPVAVCGATRLPTTASAMVTSPVYLVPDTALPSLKVVLKKQPLVLSQQSPHAPHVTGHAMYAAVEKHLPCSVGSV